MDPNLNEMGYNAQEQHTTHEEQQYNAPTVQDKEVIEEMNAANMKKNPEAYDEEDNSQMTENKSGNTTAHRYNLWPRPTQQQERLNLMQTVHKST